MSDPLCCVNHPNKETYLRCNKCGQPICTKCAVGTPVGASRSVELERHPRSMMAPGVWQRRSTNAHPGPEPVRDRRRPDAIAVSSGITGKSARSANAPWPISRRRGPRIGQTSPVE